MIRPQRRRNLAPEARGDRPPEAIGPVLRRLLDGLRIEERSREGRLASAWDRAAGEALSSRARPVALRSGVLTVEVDGAALLQEVRGFRAASLLASLRAEKGGEGVRQIRFVPAGRRTGEGA